MQPKIQRRISPLCTGIVLVAGLATLILLNSIAIYRFAAHADPAPRAIPAIHFAALRMADDSPLLPIRQSLLINSVSAVALLLSLGLVGIWLRTHMDARQSRRQFESSRRWKASLLPSFRNSAFPHLDVAADCVCASQLKGDFYDAFTLPRGRSALLLGDVGGSGASSDLLLGMIHGIVRCASWTESPAQHEAATSNLSEIIAARVSHHRCGTLFWSYFDPEERLLRFINAGHLPPLLFRAKRRSVVKLEEAGPGLGVLPAPEYRQSALRVEPGDVLVIYSDGIVDAADRTGEQFGEERLTTVVDLSRHCAAEEIRNRILASVRTFTADAVPADDRALLVMRHMPVFARDEADSSIQRSATS